MTTIAAERSRTVPATIRAYRDTDRGAVRDLQCRTAYRGLGQPTVFGDAELFADYWTSYYTDFEPESLLVAERDNGVVGYLVGCRDTRRQIRIMATRIVPAILARLAARGVNGRYTSERDRRFLGWLLAKSWREFPRVSLDVYPGHYHCNLDRSVVGRRLYSRMATRFAEKILEIGVPGVQLGITEPIGGPWIRLARAYARTSGAHLEVAETSTDFARDVLGLDEPHVNRVFAGRSEAFLGFAKWLGECRGL